jgi:hypothetical protein
LGVSNLIPFIAGRILLRIEFLQQIVTAVGSDFEASAVFDLRISYYEGS